MRTIYAYLFREIFSVAFATVSVLTFLLVLVNVFKDVFEMLLYSEVSVWIIFKLVVLLIPFALIFTLPSGILLSVLLVYGRMSQDREILALKASGIGIFWIAAPAILISLSFSVLSLTINAYLAPVCRNEFREIGYQLATTTPMAFFAAESAIDRFPGMKIWVGKKSGATLQDVHIWQMNDKNQVFRYVRAEEGNIRPDRRNQQLLIVLKNARQEDRDSVEPADIAKFKPAAKAEEYSLPLSLSNFLERVRSRSASRLTLMEIHNMLMSDKEIATINPTPYLTEYQKRLAFSFSCFTCVLVGIPLAIQAQRRETSVGVALAVTIFFSYWAIMSVAEALKNQINAYPDLLIWMPNIMFQTLGFILLWRANKH
ncbi:MAG: LptF/LptG family permease [Candidatus Methylacidiphilales bacterium]|nr:LptF/LptG family permease [Candidatus Methylacidiphilales bacterium]